MSNNTARDIVPSLKVQATDILVKDQGYTYNQATFIYNQAGVFYGGIYNVTEDIVPEVSIAYDFIPHALAGRVISNKEAIPTVSMALNLRPTIAGYSDTYTTGKPSLGKNAPGWFMYLNFD